jgi:protease-4
MSSPGSYKFGLYGYSNPAITTFLHDVDMMVGYSTRNLTIDNGNIAVGNNTDAFNRWTFQTASPFGGFGMISDRNFGQRVNDYRWSFATGSDAFSFGMSYGFVGGAKGAFSRRNSVSWGIAGRPNRYLSYGLSQIYAISDDNKNTIDHDQETVAEIAVRSLGNELISLYADAAIRRFDGFDTDRDLEFSAGAVVEPLKGIRLSARYINRNDINNPSEKVGAINFGVNVSFGSSDYTFMQNQAPESSVDGVDNSPYTTVMIRSGAKDRSIFPKINPIKYYVSLDLSGGVKYRGYKYFDNSNSLYGILDQLDQIKKSSAIKGVVINATQFSANLAMAWEIRNKLEEVKQSGKKIVVFIERVGINAYHFASVADQIVMDEQGSISLGGYVMGRSFYKNMLEKLDIGYEEIRLFKYKSAAETFSREDYSEGSREQNLALIQSWFETTKSEIASSRDGISEDKFEELVNGKFLYHGADAKDEGLVDRFGRWHDKDDVLDEIEEDAIIMPSYFANFNQPEPRDDKWGGSNEAIAVVYVEGVCAMDDGIKARSLVRTVKNVIENDNIKAVVLRVDSPGGDAMASEYIAEIVRENKGKKPIIVSQGMLAASGGYWLSMDADQIVSTPYTITGSIGVIASYMYDKGAAGELGITTDKVQVGKYADLGFSWSLPLIGIGLPTRNLSSEERSQYDDHIKEFYGDFVKRVADGRSMDSIEVHDVAQGRIWTGVDAKDKKLVDKIGSLTTAIELAKSEADLSDEQVSVYQYPDSELIDFGKLIGSVSPISTEALTDDVKMIKWIIENNGEPMPMVPIEYLELDTELK